jgi:dynactin complex subunit
MPQTKNDELEKSLRSLQEENRRLKDKIEQYDERLFSQIKSKYLVRPDAAEGS